MKKTLSILGAILSAVMISGCLDSSSKDSSGSSNNGVLVGDVGNEKGGLVGSLTVPDGTVFPQGLYFDGESTESLTLTGSGPSVARMGQIWFSPRGHTKFHRAPIITTDFTAQDFGKLDGVAFDPFRRLLFVCSNPITRMGTIHPSVVVFKKNLQGEIMWQTAMNFENKDHEMCSKIQLINGYLFASNKFADDNSYAAVYTAPIDGEELPADLSVSATYSDLGYAADTPIINTPLVSGVQKVVRQEEGKWDVFLLDQNRKKILKTQFSKAAATDPLEISGEILSLVLPADIDEPTAFLNYDDSLFFVADYKAIHAIRYSSAGAVISTSEFAKLSSGQHITDMTLGLDRFEKTKLPVFFTSNDKLQGQVFLVDEYSFNPVNAAIPEEQIEE